MTRSIGRKLFYRIFFVFILVLAIVVAGQFSASVQKKSSDQIVFKYTELNALQEFKSSLQQLIIPVNSYAKNTERNEFHLFKILLNDVRLKYNRCKKVVSPKHKVLLRESFQRMNTHIDIIENHFFKMNVISGPDTSKQFISIMALGINKEVAHLDILLQEIKKGINKNIIISNTSYLHSSITRLMLGLLTILAIIIGGYMFSKKMTKPIHTMVEFTKKISQDDLDTKVVINTNDELHILADSFNLMIENLKKTTVSRNYLDDILKSMFNPLIVTDNNGIIKSVNHSTTKLFEYTDEELIGKDIGLLFDNSLINNESPFFCIKKLMSKRTTQNAELICQSKSGNIIPALFSCSVIKKQNGEMDGLVVVLYNLLEKKEIETKLENIRKENTIAINEAQEEERLRIAIELHDGLGQLLTAISYFIQNYFIEQMKDNAEYQDNLNHLHTLLDYAIIEAKDISHDLIPIALKDFGLKVAVKRLIDQANKRSKINFEFNAFNFEQRIDVKLEKSLYRICQEAVNNMVKHSKAKNADFQIIMHENLLSLVIEDDGVGFDTSKVKNSHSDEKSGIGLMSMEERVIAFNGSITINSEKDKGTEILIEIPC